MSSKVCLVVEEAVLCKMRKLYRPCHGCVWLCKQQCIATPPTATYGVPMKYYVRTSLDLKVVCLHRLSLYQWMTGIHASAPTCMHERWHEADDGRHGRRLIPQQDLTQQRCTASHVRHKARRSWALFVIRLKPWPQHTAERIVHRPNSIDGRRIWRPISTASVDHASPAPSHAHAAGWHCCAESANAQLLRHRWCAAKRRHAWLAMLNSGLTDCRPSVLAHASLSRTWSWFAMRVCTSLR
jgi:hypothetical protein